MRQKLMRLFLLEGWAHTAVKRGARAQFLPKPSLNKVLHFRKFSLSSEISKVKTVAEKLSFNFAYDQEIY